MPIHDYHCNDCQAAFELLVRSSTVPACPHCGSLALARGISLTAAPGKTAGLLAGARRQASREGHFSHYSKAEKAKAKLR